MSEPLKVGLVGTGAISDRHMTAYLEHPDRVQLTAVCDIDEPLAKEYARKAGVEAVYLDYDNMLREADIDAVDICTGHYLHAPQTIAAAAAGKHVIVEKAMSITLQDCRAMIEATDRAGVTLMVAQHLRYSPEAYAVKRLIDDGKLGEIQAARTHVFRQGPQKSWYTDAKSGGGVLQLNTVHYIDLLRYYVGNVKRVTGVCRSVQPQMTNGAEDLVAATLEFENGAIGDLFSSWTTNLAPESSSYMVLGSKGTIHSTPPATAKDDSPIRHFGIVMFGEKESEREKPTNQPFEPLDTSDIVLPSTSFFVNEILHFEECIRTGSEPLSSGRDNIETMKVVLGIQESSRTGKSVDLAAELALGKPT
jgi:predicted dehydrogenase